VARSILIVDDSKLARMAVIKWLIALHPDWTRLEAGNAEEAQRVVERDAPDIVVLDFNMPGKDGLTFASELRAAYPRMPIAVISANKQSEVVSRAQAAGARFLAKPLAQDDLADFLNSALQQL
jgi:DNA-binding NarL/FixJ family response regulator